MQNQKKTTPNETQTPPVKPAVKAPGHKKPEEKATIQKVKPKKEKSPLKIMILTAIFWILPLLCAIFFIANLFEGAGPLIRGFCAFFYGLFGFGGLSIILILVVIAMEWRKSTSENRLSHRLIFTSVGMLLISVIIHLIVIMAGGIEEPAFSNFFKITAFWYHDGPVGGGVIGGFIASFLYVLMHGWVSLVLTLIVLFTTVMLYFRQTPITLLRALIRWIKKKKALRAKRNEEAERARLKHEAERKLAEKQAAEEAARLAASQPVKASNEEEEEEDEEEAEEEKPVQKKSIFARGIELHFDDEEKTEEEEPVKETSNSEVPIYIYSETESEPVPRKAKKEENKYSFKDIPEMENSLAGTESVDCGHDHEGKALDFNALIEAGKQQAQEDRNATLPPDDEDDDEDDMIIPGTTDEITEPEKKAYVFPPITLLSPNENPKTEDDREELMRNAKKLVEVLRSFRVDTDIVNISRGPTITRYELAPKVGVRVRAIANLVDDIALNLETSGVRIEAPIPGKAAVGVEVPNRSQATVYLRDLIESDAFKNAKSKLTACVGMDVSGAPVLMDIAKMPHLLIAGATGMGKSVGVNSIIMSLLYKATPDELKLILVDPKKVELNMYNKLPHLLIPVVNNPKKAAGALSTAVNEMERRFELIESVGVRDIKGYNQLAENDPTKEKLPHIVIIIDELADLMMTAKDDVEDSICRIAQKARAAGIHLIICTQRPSVDVITGLIKANVPSRIAFTVASNIDSRTIIDIAGAEKLIGRGDMLFAPVGAMKPMRVQGTFVSDKEVEAVTDFIKSQSSDVHYDDAFINMVDAEAERCGQQKKKVGGDEIDGDDNLDPKFYEALEIAMDAGELSTSALQRRLSLGYGRAAKIIDQMEQMGIVGGKDGQKARKVLISHQEYQELIMARGDI